LIRKPPSSSSILPFTAHLLGDIATHREPPEVEPAETYFCQALALAGELSALYAQISQRQQARTALTAAIGLYRAMDMTFWLPQAEAALAQVEN
jgi:hypothetical protein